MGRQCRTRARLPARICFELLRVHARIGRVVAEAGALVGAGAIDGGVHGGADSALALAGQLGVGDGGNLDMEVDAVEQGA